MANVHRTARAKQQKHAEKIAKGGRDHKRAMGGNMPMTAPSGVNVPQLKTGGPVKGKTPSGRLDKKARGGGLEGGEEVYKSSPQTKVEHPPMKYTNVDSEPPPKRAMGGIMPHGKKHKGGKTNIIIHAGGGGADQNAIAQAKEQGMQEGAMKVMGALKAKMAGAGAPGGAPGGMPPGAPPGGPPMGGPPPGAPPMGGPPGMPPMHKAGGTVNQLTNEKRDDSRTDQIKVRGYVRRRGGACA